MTDDEAVMFRVARAGVGPTLYAAAALDRNHRSEEDAFFPFTRLCQFLPSTGIWLHHDVPHYVMGLCSIIEPTTRVETLVAISDNGEVFYKDSTQGRNEHIRRPEMFGGRNPPAQRLTGITQIGDRLYACGGDGQIYVRFGTTWELLDPSLLPPDRQGLYDAIDVAGDDWAAILAVDSAPWTGQDRIKSFHNVNGPHEHEVYCTGYDGGLLHWNGEHSNWITNVPKQNLFDILVEDERRIWICGSNGTLIRGNHRDGFADLSPGGELSLNTMTMFQGRLWLTANGGFGGPSGLFTYEDGRLQRAATGLTPDIHDIHTVDSAAGVLWAVGYKDIFCFDGDVWTRIDHPDNSPMRRP